MISFLSLFALAAAIKSVRRQHAIERPLARVGTQRNFTDGTEPQLQTIFLGKCYQVASETPGLSVSDCQRVWKLFYTSFAFKVDEHVTPGDFDPFFKDDQVRHSLEATGKRSLFWSGVQDVVAQFQQSCHLFVMETSPLVALLDDLMFCASPTDPSGMNMTECVYGDVTNGQWAGTWVSFWAAASAAYAPSVSGNITLLFSGNKQRPAYRRTSFFGSIELPRLNTQNITGAVIFVAPQRPDEPIYEPCGTGSLALLVSDLVAQGIDASTISCVNEPRVVRHLQCSLYYTIPECAFANATVSAEQQ